MDFRLSEEQQAVRELAREILNDQVDASSLRELEESGDWFHAAVWEQLARAELLGVGLPSSVGGGDAGFVALSLLMQEIGRAVAPVPALETLVLGALPIARFGTDAQREAWTEGLVAGRRQLTAALSDEGSRDPLRPETVAVTDGTGWRLQGVKTAVAGLDRAHRVLVPARTDTGSTAVFAVAPDAEGLEREAQIALHHEPWCRLVLDGTPVTADDRLGDDTTAADVLRWSVERAQAGLAALQLGVSQRALELTAAYAREREQFGQPIGAFQAVSHRAADSYIDLQIMEVCLWRAAWLLEHEQEAGRDVTVARYWATEGGHRIGAASQHLHGGAGFDRDYPLQRYHLWTKRLELTLGGAQHHLAELGRRVAAETRAEAEAH